MLYVAYQHLYFAAFWGLHGGAAEYLQVGAERVCHSALRAYGDAVSSPTRAAGDTEADAQPDRWWDYLSNVCLPGELRLNLSFVLRDHATTLHYHFNVGNSVSFYDHQLVLRIDLDPDISLPYVDAYSGTGFGADVTPWDQQTPIDVSF